MLVRIRRLLQVNHDVPRLSPRGVVLPSHCLELVERVQPAPTKRLGREADARRRGAVAALPSLIAVGETVHCLRVEARRCLPSAKPRESVALVIVAGSGRARPSCGDVSRGFFPMENDSFEFLFVYVKGVGAESLVSFGIKLQLGFRARSDERNQGSQQSLGLGRRNAEFHSAARFPHLAPSLTCQPLWLIIANYSHTVTAGGWAAVAI